MHIIAVDRIEIFQREVAEINESKVTIDSIPVVHLEMVRDNEIAYGKHTLSSPKDVSDMFIPLIGNRDREHLLVCAVDSKNRPSKLQITGIGTQTACLFSVPDIWKMAVLSNAAGIIVAHNHPSGLTDPSEDDISATRKLISAGKILEIPILDHLIIGMNSYYSFYENMPELWEKNN